jgi:hypothetical protein
MLLDSNVREFESSCQVLTACLHIRVQKWSLISRKFCNYILDWAAILWITTVIDTIIPSHRGQVILSEVDEVCIETGKQR